MDTKMVKLIVLEANIGSMTEFKQIIGRGTRIREEEGKVYFTIMDFKRATNLFADPEFDGEPVIIYEPEDGESAFKALLEEVGAESAETDVTIDEFIPDPKKFYINNVSVSIINERVQYYGADGRLITESLIDYTKTNIKNNYSSLDQFILKWNDAEKKEELLSELAEQGILLEALKEEVGKDMDAFDLICHVAFDQPPLTRKERAENVRKRNYFGKYSEKAQEVIKILLDKYENEGTSTIEKGSVLKVNPFTAMGSPIELVRHFGTNQDFEKAVKELEKEIYQSA
jgi:type I restriction enzyme R subunit